jgi:phosphoglycerol transferase MdoB-like AlkP superfamily enzyme
MLKSPIRWVRSSPRLGFMLTMLAVMVGLATLTRLGLAAWVAVAGEPGQVGKLLLALVAGIPMDIGFAVLFSLPFVLALLVLRPLLRKKWFGWVGHTVTWAVLSGLVFGAVAEFFFWNEFDSRFNGIAVNYIIFPREVIGNIQQSFDLTLDLPPVLIVGLVLYLLLRGRLQAALAVPYRRGEALALFGGTVLAAALALPIVYVGPATFPSNREVGQVADNGLRSLFAAFFTNDADYEGLYATVPQADIVPALRASVQQDNTSFLTPDDQQNLWRHVENGDAPKHPNIVLVIEESFGSFFFDGIDNYQPVELSHDLTELAKGGMLFTNVYATGDRTVRGLEALLTSFTPIPGISTARRDGSEGMNSLPFLLKRQGYDTAFLYGGRKVFDNMGHYWSTIGFDRVWDQNDIANPGFTTIWGVADEYLFTEALQRLDMQADRHVSTGRPMFLSLLTVSNHRPHTFPDTNGPYDPKIGKFENSARYAAWAFADFVKRARSHSWFDDTVFIFIGDHGPRISGAAQVPVEGFRVPLLFYGPKYIPAARLDTLGSSMDMAPTLLGLLGVTYDSPFFGVDLRHVPAGGGRIAMAHNYSVAFGDLKDGKGELVVLQPSRVVQGFTFTPGATPAIPKRGPDADLAHRAIAITEGAHQMFYAHGYHELGGTGDIPGHGPHQPQVSERTAQP